MPILGYKKQFAPLVEWVIKRQTIRAYGKRKFKVGDKLYSYAGVRTKHCYSLGVFMLKSIGHVVITQEGVILFEDGKMRILYDIEEKQKFARADGFKDWPTMVAWFGKTHGLPFAGIILRW